MNELPKASVDELNTINACVKAVTERIIHREAEKFMKRVPVSSSELQVPEQAARERDVP